MGLKPDQKDALEYEFAIALRMDQDHIAEATKDNSNMFDLPFNVSLETGRKITGRKIISKGGKIIWK